MSPIRLHEAIRCGRRAYICAAPDRPVWACAVPVLQRGPLRPGVRGRLVREFAESDYCFGIGPLTLNVEHIDWDHPVPYEGDSWLEVQGVVVDRAGREGARREVLVRAARLPLRPPRRRPHLRP